MCISPFLHFNYSSGIISDHPQTETLLIAAESNRTQDFKLPTTFWKKSSEKALRNSQSFKIPV